MAIECEKVTQKIPVTVAWIIFITTSAMFFLFPLPDLCSRYGYTLAAVQGIITFFVAINFCFSACMDPGVIPRASPYEDDGEDDFRCPLYKIIDIKGTQVRMKWCVTCQFYRPPRSSHCSNCDTCVDTFDHHCPWVNNCIGRRNYRHFFSFLICLSIDIVNTFAFCILYISDDTAHLNGTNFIVTLLIVSIVSVLSIPIIGLTLFHVYLIAVGRTTNEQVTGRFADSNNPFSGGCCHNFCATLCGPQYPRRRRERDISLRSSGSFNSAAVLCTSALNDGKDKGAPGNNVQVSLLTDGEKCNIMTPQSPTSELEMLPHLVSLNDEKQTDIRIAISESQQSSISRSSLNYAAIDYGRRANDEKIMRTSDASSSSLSYHSFSTTVILKEK